MGKYDDRFDAQHTHDEEPCRFSMSPDARDEDAPVLEAWIPLFLCKRPRHLALAYELPLLSRLPTRGDWTYPEIQCPELLDEIAFLFDHVSDPLLTSAMQPVSTMISAGYGEQRGRSLVVELP
jgi:hypothetical protein